MTQMTEAYDWHGRELVDADGEKVGTIAQLFQDLDTDQPEWATVSTGLFGSKLSFVPIQNAEPSGEQVRVPFAKAQIKDAPKIDDSDDQLSQEEEAALYAHYGISYGEQRSGSGLPEGEIRLRQLVQPCVCGVERSNDNPGALVIVHSFDEGLHRSFRLRASFRPDDVARALDAVRLRDQGGCIQADRRVAPNREWSIGRLGRVFTRPARRG
jgi:hypothetical protein